MIMGTIGVHEFITLDGVIDTPSWTFDYPFDPRMGEAISRITDPGGAILLGRNTYEMFEPAWSTRTAEDDPGAPFFNDTHKYVVSSTVQRQRHPRLEGPGGREDLRQRQRHPGARAPG